LKLAGYGDRSDELDQYKLLFSLMQNQAEQAFKGRQEEREGRKETREGLKTKSDIEAAALKSQIDYLNLQRQIQEMQQKGQTGQLDALVELAKIGDKTALAALSKASPAYAEAKAGEQEATSKWRAGEMEGALLPLYQGGKRKELATQMALNEPEFKLNPRLVDLVNWQRLAQEWPVEPATLRPDATTVSQAPGGAVPWRYGTGTQPIPESPAAFYAGGGPSAMPGQIDPEVLRRFAQQVVPLPNVSAVGQGAAWQHQIPQAVDFGGGAPGFEYLPGGPSAMPYTRSMPPELTWLYGNRFQNMNINMPPPGNLDEGVMAAQGLEAPRMPVFGAR
jgi:hypothetical protein